MAVGLCARVVLFVAAALAILDGEFSIVPKSPLDSTVTNCVPFGR
jgi:hypothetical protein